MSSAANGRDWLTIEEALEAGIPRKVLEAAWRESDARLGTNMAGALIARHFGDDDAKRQEFIEPKGERPKPSVFIQWKGTDVCFDFDCECGEHLHFDGYFAYFPRCSFCGTVWEMPCYLYPRKADEGQEPTVEMAE